MKKHLLILTLVVFSILPDVMAQPATYSNIVALGRNRCGSSGADSVYFLNYVSPNLTNTTTPITACRPLLRTNFAPLSGYSAANKPFVIFNASVAFNPADQMLYYVWTDYNIPAPYKSYIYRWDPTTCPTAGPTGLDTLRTFNTDIGGITFDANGTAWQLEFSGSAPHQARLRQVNFTTGVVGIPDTLDLTGGKQLWNVGTGDITLTSSGQMYFIFNNKLFTPDYGSAGGPTKHIKCTYIDTVRLPTGKTGLPGLAFGSGDLVASYSPAGCIFKRIDPITGDTASVTYTYPVDKGIWSTDMTQINSGIGPSKRLVSITYTGTPQQYDVVYDVYVRNYGNVPLTNVQLTDNLTQINGAANLANVTAVMLSNPAGVTINPLFNGNTNINLLAAGQSLPCFPVANNNFTVRISCRISGVLNGVIYNNSAIATASGFKNVALRDSSTNGSNPDLNQNDKTDDLGEGQPTPFLIALTPVTPPCAVLSQVLYNQTFGAGTGLVASLPATPSASASYVGTATAPLPINRFTVTNNASNGDPSNWINLTDHTGGANGRMLLVNADASAGIMYRDTLPVSCPGQQYSISLWAAFIGNSSYEVVCDGLGGFKYPKLLMRIRDRTTGLLITQATTTDITFTTWQHYGMKWVMPPGYTNVILEIINAGVGGCGNDVAIDDIQYGICDPQPTVGVSTGAFACLNDSTTFTANLSDPSVIPGTKDYQWQVAPASGGPWVNILGATAMTYTINPVTALDTGKYYRVIVAAQGNIGVASCQYISSGVLLNGKVPSLAATSANRDKNNICPGISVQLSLTGGSLGTNASWRWYSGSCGGTFVGTGTTVNVTPAVTTTYYVFAQGDCNTTACRQVTVNINCDIDKDKDGITDYVESNMAVAMQDANANGVINAFDAGYPGFIDYNYDFINDNFQADGDSDNDGTPNYLDLTFPGRVDVNLDGVDDRFDFDLDARVNMLDLDSDNDGVPDVVEAYGVDTDGDAKLDNYTDTDNDGLSQSVDANNTGSYISGNGLGVPNFDGDAAFNYIDLDSDNDGIPDVVEAGGIDVNNNGIIDGFVDANNDGISDNAINASALLLTGADISGDGRADTYPNKNLDRDFRPNAYDVDADGDGIVDVIEAGLPDANLNGIVDGTIGNNGWSTTVSGMPALNLRSTDTDGKFDYLDIDSDDDGIPDNIEGMSTMGYLLPTLIDTDGDGLMSPYDNVIGFSGSGIFLYDHDSDGTPDYRDLDTDSDGQPDIIEGNDFNLNNLADDNVTLTGLDIDFDGLDNRFDSLNSVTNIKGTSYRMGDGGTFTGDPTPGSRTTVQKRMPANADRDWRFVGAVLPVEFLKFTGVLQNTNVLLNWTIITSEAINRFEIERSVDNSSFIKVGTVNDAVQLNTAQQFGHNDDITGINNEILYYRLKVIGENGRIKYSPVLVVKRSNIKTAVSVMPNPATAYVTLRFFAEKESIISIRLIDYAGKTLMLSNQKALKGNNSIQLNDLGKFSNGLYTLQLMLNGELINQKLLLAR